MPETSDPREPIRAALVNLLLALRSEYLAAGANPLKHWDQLHERLRAAVVAAVSIPALVTALASSLKLQAPGSWRSSATVALADLATVAGIDEVLAVIEEEHAYLIALARVEAEERRERRQERAAAEAVASRRIDDELTAEGFPGAETP